MHHCSAGDRKWIASCEALKRTAQYFSAPFKIPPFCLYSLNLKRNKS